MIILDDLERLLEYVPIGPRFSNTMLLTLLVFATGTNEDFLRECDLFPCFDLHVEVPLLSKEEIVKTLSERGVFDDAGLAQLDEAIYLDIGIKQLQLITEMAVTTAAGGKVDIDTFRS